MTTASKLRKNYDTIIIGGGLSGTLIAHHLQKRGQQTLIVDRNEIPGGHCRYHESQAGRFSQGLKVLPNMANAEHALTTFRDTVMPDLTWEKAEIPPVTFEAGFKPFVGFGDEAPEYVEALNYYTQAEFLEMNQAPHQWVEKLLEDYTGDFLPQSFVTRILVEEGKAQGILVNGSKKVPCENIVFAGQPKDLPVLVGEDHLNNKTRRALAKSSVWTTVAYDIVFDREICDHQAMHVLMGAKDKTEACVGRFSKTDPETGLQLSQWIGFMSNEQAEDSELIAGCLKRIQKQLKRAYPDCFEAKKTDRIMVSMGSHGTCELPLTGHQTLAQIENVWLAGPFVQKVPNLIGTLNQAQLVLGGMGFSPEAEETPENYSEMDANP